jgi:hypothetical protein
MNRVFSFLRPGFAALCAVAMFAAQADAAPVFVPAPDHGLPTALIQSDCYAIGQQVAEQNGGTLARASQSSQGGRPVCVIVVLVPGKDGQRPRRREIVVPLD